MSESNKPYKQEDFIAIWRRYLRILARYVRKYYDQYKDILFSTTYENCCFEYNVRLMRHALIDEMHSVSHEMYRGLGRKDENWDEVETYAEIYAKNFIFSADHSSPWQEFRAFDFLKDFLVRLKDFEMRYDTAKVAYWTAPEKDKTEQITEDEWNEIISAMRG